MFLTPFAWNTTTNTACFAQKICIPKQQTRNLRTRNESLKPCIKKAVVNPLSTNRTKWQTTSRLLTTNCLSLFGRFVGLVLKWLNWEAYTYIFCTLTTISNGSWFYSVISFQEQGMIAHYINWFTDLLEFRNVKPYIYLKALVLFK